MRGVAFAAALLGCTVVAAAGDGLLETEYESEALTMVLVRAGSVRYILHLCCFCDCKAGLCWKMEEEEEEIEEC